MLSIRPVYPSEPASRPAPLLISIAVHAVVLTLALWLMVRASTPPASGFYGTADSGWAQGVGKARPVPPEGASVGLDEGMEYVGRYPLRSARGTAFVLDIELINDGSSLLDHFSLLTRDSRGSAQKLIVAGRDTFTYQLDPSRAVVFLRSANRVSTLELHERRQVMYAARTARH